MSTPEPSNVRNFLRMLRATPTLMLAAPPVGEAWRLISHRTRDEVHSCLRCGHRAQVAYVADTDAGRRWLDLCAPCDHWMRCGMDQAEREEEHSRLARRAYRILANEGWKP